MTYWTLMMITILSGPLEGSQQYLVYQTMDSCLAAVNSVTDTLEYDYKVECQDSDTASGSIRPKARP